MEMLAKKFNHFKSLTKISKSEGLNEVTALFSTEKVLLWRTHNVSKIILNYFRFYLNTYLYL